MIMGIHKNFFNRKLRADKTTSHAEDEDTIQICRSCGKVFKMYYRYCPYCGIQSDLFKSRENDKEDVLSNPRNMVPQISSIDEMSISYLKSIGLLDQAQKLFNVRISLPNREDSIMIQLTGASRSNDALACLREMNYLSTNGDYKFTDWPHANPVIGPGYHLVSACVCELPNRVYHIIEYCPMVIQELYGCPSVFEQNDPTLRKTVEVIDYVQ